MIFLPLSRTDMGDPKYICQECGCLCESCVNNNSLHLHREIQVLRQQVLDRDYHIVQMETKVLSEAQCFPQGSAGGDSAAASLLDAQALRDDLRFWQDKYNRLLESHRKLQKVNQSLEDKLLKIVDKYETEKNSLTRDISDLTSKLLAARYSIAELEVETEQYRNDCNIAVHLLQCKPSNFMAHKFASLPLDLQEKVRESCIRRSTTAASLGGLPHPSTGTGQQPIPDQKVIRVPISTFPPTAMVYSVNKPPSVTKTEPSATPNPCPDLVSAAIMAKILEERAKERSHRKQQDCRCSNGNALCVGRQECTEHKATQTTVCCHIHTRGRSGSSSSADSNNYHPLRQSSASSTETII